LKQQWIISLGVAATIALSACSGSPAAPTAAPAAPTAPQPTAAPATAPTSAPTVAPTTAPTTAPTVAPTVAATPTEEAQPTAAATPNSASVASTPVAGGPEVQLGDVQKVAQAWSQVKSFRIKSEGGSNAQFAGEFVSPDKSHVTVSSSGQSFEYIEIGTTSYTKINGTWTKHTGTSSDMSFDPNKLVADFNDSKQSGKKVTKGAVETVNGAKCQEWVSTDSDGASTSLCVGLDNNLPIQAKSSDGKSVVDFYDYNAPITIQAPI
jgi:hypothetical protein